MTNEEIEEIFTYHTPQGEQVQAFQSLSDQYRSLAHNLASFGLGTTQKAEAIQRLLESLMWAEAHAAVSGGGTEKANDRLMAKHAAIAAAQSKPEYPVFVSGVPVDAPADVPMETVPPDNEERSKKK